MTNAHAAAAKTINVEQFKQLARDAKPLAVAVVAARAFAAAERARVDAYIAPVFAQFTFSDDEGQRIETAADLYRSDDDATCAAFYAACDVAHAANGFTGAPGYCPALIAEHAVIQAERALIEFTAPAFGVDPDAPQMETRKKWLDLMIGAANIGATR